jgi:hypothetical protein
MTETIIQKEKRRPNKKKKDKIKRWSIVFVEDSDNEREDIKKILQTSIEKKIENQIYND